MRKILKTAVTYTAMGAFALLMGAAAIGCTETIREPAVQGPPGPTGMTGATGAQGADAVAPTVSKSSTYDSTTTSNNGAMPSSSSSTTTEKSSSSY